MCSSRLKKAGLNNEVVRIWRKKQKLKNPKKEAAKEVPRTKEATKGENVVLIGKKPVMNYVVACITFFNTGEKAGCCQSEGAAISRAVDTVKLFRCAFVKNLEVKNIDLGTEELVREEGRKSNVSTIEITVIKA